jgi:enoyl-CoA hydratase/carnithine racemase
MTPTDVTYEAEGALAVVSLNRPQYRNAQSWQLLDELDQALDRACAESEIKVVIVKGSGDHFSSGHDLGTPEQEADFKSRGLDGTSIERLTVDYYNAFRKYNLDLTLKWRNLPKPTIAMVHGYCIYGGWMIAAAMDLVFAADDAMFLTSMLEYFSAPWDMNPRKAKELLFESRFIGAREAAEIGFVNRVYPRERLDEETRAYARRVAENSRQLLRMFKLGVNKAQDVQGFSAAIEASFADYMLMSRMRGSGRAEGQRRLGGVDLALRGLRGERPGLDSGSE